MDTIGAPFHDISIYGKVPSLDRPNNINYRRPIREKPEEVTELDEVAE